MPQAITVTERPDGVAVLTFDQPGSKANVLTRELWTEFGATLTALRSDLKGLVLASAKPGIFIAGADLKLLANAPAPNDPEVRAFIEQGLRVLEQLEALPFPTCAAIDGAALGGGLEVALACDFRLVGRNEKVKLALPEISLGLIPGWGGTQRLPRIAVTDAGLTQAIEVVLNRASYSPATSLQGLAAISAPPKGLLDDAANRVEALHQTGAWAEIRAEKGDAIPAERHAAFRSASGLTVAAAEAVRVMVEGAALPLYDAIKLETEAFMRLAGSDESKRLIAEFFASRKK
jgi:enoyl-CoA hydratase/carnithine racemase